MCTFKLIESTWGVTKKIKIDVLVTLKVLKLLLCCGGLRNTCFVKTSRTSDTRNP